MEALFWIFVGASIGWHFPQPAWASNIGEKLKVLFNTFNRK